jgi:hypothetical protein
MSAAIATFGLRIIPEPGAQIERCRSYVIDGFCGQNSTGGMTFCAGGVIGAAIPGAVGRAAGLVMPS